MLVFFTNLSYGISSQMFGLIFSFFSIRWLTVVLDGKSSQEYPGNAGVSQAYVHDPTHILLHINNLFVDVICNIGIYDDHTTLYSKYD